MKGLTAMLKGKIAGQNFIFDKCNSKSFLFTVCNLSTIPNNNTSVKGLPFFVSGIKG